MSDISRKKPISRGAMLILFILGATVIGMVVALLKPDDQQAPQARMHISKLDPSPGAFVVTSVDVTPLPEGSAPIADAVLNMSLYDTRGLIGTRDRANVYIPAKGIRGELVSVTLTRPPQGALTARGVVMSSRTSDGLPGHPLSQVTNYP